MDSGSVVEEAIRAGTKMLSLHDARRRAVALVLIAALVATTAIAPTRHPVAGLRW
jgi:hypothetical protein